MRRFIGGFPSFPVMTVRSRTTYFAERLWKSMKGAGTNDSALVRIVVSRSEVGRRLTMTSWYGDRKWSYVS